MSEPEFIIIRPWTDREAVGQVLVHRHNGDCYMITSAHGDIACTSLPSDFSLSELANPESGQSKAWGCRYYGTIAPACHFEVKPQ